MCAYRKWIKETENPFSQLLFTILLLFIATFFSTTSRFSLTVVGVLFLGVLILSFRTLDVSHKVFRTCVSCAGATYVLDTMATHFFQGSAFLKAVASISYAVLLALSIVILSRRVFREKRVTGDTLRGSTCIYLLIGYFWFLIYRAIQYIDPDAFYVSIERSGNTLLYFSFVTLTTMGYGDIVPVNMVAMACANIEGMIGILYPAVFIARLVSVYTTQAADREPPE